MGIFEFIRRLFGGGSDTQPASAPESLPLLEQAIEERRHKPRINAREGTRVLVIDDSKTIVTVLRKFLRSAGYEVYEALDAEAGLLLMHQHKPELVFLDIVLPGMNGFAALRAIRRDPELRETPVIMMSGNEQAMEQFFGTRIGADDFMKKPFSRHEAFFRIERLLDDSFIPRRAHPQAQAGAEIPAAAVATTAAI